MANEKVHEENIKEEYVKDVKSVEHEQPAEVLEKTKESGAAAEIGTNEVVESMIPAQGSLPRAKKLEGSKGFSRFVKSKLGISFIAVTGVLVLLAVLYTIPSTRYGILGTILKKDVAISITDRATGKPVSQAEVVLAGQKAVSDAQGKAKFAGVPVGEYQVTVTKKYYKDVQHAAIVPVFSAPDEVALKFEATGRQVPVKVVNKLSGKPVEKAVVSSLETSAATDAKGEAVIVLPADKVSVPGKVALEGYNTQEVTITVTEQKDDKNTQQLTPSGKIYFLSKRTGNIDVMKSDLDGGNAEVVVKATGKEDERNTVLLAARDWKYLALKAKRDGDKEKLYLIDTATGKLTVIDEGDVTFTLTGWSGHRFIFSVYRYKLDQWAPKLYALKSFNAETSSLSTLDETDAVNQNAYDVAYQYFDSVYILDDLVLYTKSWQFGNFEYGDASRKVTISINSIRPDGAKKQTLKEFDLNYRKNQLFIRLYKPQELYFQFVPEYNYAASTYWEYENGKIVETKDITAENFDKGYPTYLLSPSGRQSFWYESRDGKNALFLGDGNGEKSKEIGSLNGYTPYGWFGDDYLLFAKNSSELYVAPAGQVDGEQSLTKVTDYHKPDYTYYGYGYGYGGL